MANEYKAWYRGNDPQNAREGWDAYNRPFGERYERPSEYQDVRGDAYRHFPERYDITEDQDKKRVEAGEQRSEDKARQSQRARTARAGQSAVKSVVQSVAGNVVAIAVGAGVLVGGYTAIEAQKAASQVPVVQSMTWQWSDNQEDAVFVISYGEDVPAVELPAIVSSTEVPATCTMAGSVVYTATATDEDGNVYTDTRTTIVDPIGHEFDGGTPIEQDGHAGVVYECTHCHEQFTIISSIEEND